MRLIDADALFENLKENDYFKARTVATISAKAVIYFAPTIDAVEVVRCKECEYFQKSRIVDNWTYCDRAEFDVSKDDFCSYGKRKGGDE